MSKQSADPPTGRDGCAVYERGKMKRPPRWERCFGKHDVSQSIFSLAQLLQLQLRSSVCSVDRIRSSSRSVHSSFHLTSPHLVWPDLSWAERVAIGRSHGEAGRLTAHHPVRRGCDQSERTKFRWNGGGWDEL